ncbi:MAG: leucine-rich repeat domain-containing protein [Promethearchaeota archaeon]
MGQVNLKVRGKVIAVVDEGAVTIDLSNCGIRRLSDVPGLNKLLGLRVLNLSRNRLHGTVSLRGIRGLEELNLEGNEIERIKDLDGLSGLRVLNLNWNVVSDVKCLSSLVSLEVLGLSNNSIKDISGISSLVNLRKLDLSNNLITGIGALSALHELQDLDLSGNKLSTMDDLESFGSLRHLNVSCNEIDEISGLGSCHELLELDLGNNEIGEIKNLSKLRCLEVLDLLNNRISEIKGLSSLECLRVLNLCGNKIGALFGLGRLTDLEVLDVSKNKLESMAGLDNLENLVRLNLSWNGITEISGLENKFRLKELNLDGNQISEIKGLSGLKSLRHLKLNLNLIEVIDGLHNLSGLRVLELAHNQVSRISGLDGLVNLCRLDLSNNPIQYLTGLCRLLNLRVLKVPGYQLADISGLDLLVGLEEIDFGLVQGFEFGDDVLSVLEHARKERISSCPAGLKDGLASLYKGLQDFSKLRGEFVSAFESGRLDDVDLEASLKSFRSELDRVGNIITGLVSTIGNDALDKVWNECTNVSRIIRGYIDRGKMLINWMLDCCAIFRSPDFLLDAGDPERALDLHDNLIKILNDLESNGVDVESKLGLVLSLRQRACDEVARVLLSDLDELFKKVMDFRLKVDLSGVLSVSDEIITLLSKLRGLGVGLGGKEAMLNEVIDWARLKLCNRYKRKLNDVFQDVLILVKSGDVSGAVDRISNVQSMLGDLKQFGIRIKDIFTKFLDNIIELDKLMEEFPEKYKAGLIDKCVVIASRMQGIISDLKPDFSPILHRVDRIARSFSDKARSLMLLSNALTGMYSRLQDGTSDETALELIDKAREILRKLERSGVDITNNEKVLSTIEKQVHARITARRSLDVKINDFRALLQELASKFECGSLDDCKIITSTLSRLKDEIQSLDGTLDADAVKVIEIAGQLFENLDRFDNSVAHGDFSAIENIRSGMMDGINDASLFGSSEPSVRTICRFLDSNLKEAASLFDGFSRLVQVLNNGTSEDALPVINHIENKLENLGDGNTCLDNAVSKILEIKYGIEQKLKATMDLKNFMLCGYEEMDGEIKSLVKSNDLESADATINRALDLLDNLERLNVDVKEKRAYLMNLKDEIERLIKQQAPVVMDVSRTGRRAGVVEELVETTDDKIRVHLPVKFCIVCKKKLGGVVFTCNNIHCQTTYCIDCANSIAQGENKCWTCGQELNVVADMMTELDDAFEEWDRREMISLYHQLIELIAAGKKEQAAYLLENIKKTASRLNDTEYLEKLRELEREL